MCLLLICELHYCLLCACVDTTLISNTHVLYTCTYVPQWYVCTYNMYCDTVCVVSNLMSGVIEIIRIDIR